MSLLNIFIEGGELQEDCSANFPGGIESGSWSCEGNGVVARPLYYQGQMVGTEYGNNGQCGYEEGSIGYDWVYTHPDQVPDNKVCCPHCGEYLYTYDARYATENPNASAGHYGRIEGEHDEVCLEQPEGRQKLLDEFQAWNLFNGNCKLVIKELRAAAKFKYQIEVTGYSDLHKQRRR